MFYIHYVYETFLFYIGGNCIKESSLQSLYITLKDYNNDSLIVHQTTSESRTLKNAAREEGFKIEHVALQGDSRILTKIVITNRMSEMVAKDLISATEKLQKLLPLVLVNNLVIEGKLYSIYFCNTAMLM